MHCHYFPSKGPSERPASQQQHATQQHPKPSAHLQSTRSLFFSQSTARGVGTFAQHSLNLVADFLPQLVGPCIAGFQKPEFMSFIAS